MRLIIKDVKIVRGKDCGHTGTSWYVVVRDETDLAK